MRVKLDHEARCAECDAVLAAGTEVNGGYRNGAVYGIGCHAYRSRYAKAKGGRRGVPTGSRYARPDRSQEDYCCSDAGYEEQCERAYERANGGW